MDSSSWAAWAAAVVAAVAAGIAFWQAIAAKRQVEYARRQANAAEVQAVDAQRSADAAQEQLELLKQQHQQEVHEKEEQRRLAMYDRATAVVSAVNEIESALRNAAMDLRSGSPATRWADKIRDLVRELDNVYFSRYVPISRDADEPLDGLVRQLRYTASGACERFISALQESDSSVTTSDLASTTADVLKDDSFQLQLKLRAFAGQRGLPQTPTS